MKKIFSIIFLIMQILLVCPSNYCCANTLEFFTTFNDEILLENLSRAVENNIDLKIANLKVKESEKIVKLSLSQELPQIDFAPLMGKTFSSSNLLRGNNNFMINSYSQTRFLLPVYISWEADIWGKNRLKTKSTKKSLEIIKQDEKLTKIILSSAVALDYYSLVRIDKLLELEEELLRLNKQYETLITKKEKQGLETKDNVLTAKENAVKTQLRINNLKVKKEVLENQLNYLIADKLFSPIKRISYDNLEGSLNIPDVLDSQILLNRPDVIAKSENLIRAEYDARIAKRDILPSFTIAGTFGFNGYNNLAGIFKSHSGIAEVFVAPQFNIFDGGKKINFLKLKQLELEQAKEEYQKVILQATQEVNDSLAILKNENNNLELSSNIYDIQSEKVKIKTNNKNHGLSNELECITYTIARIIAQEKLIEDKINLIIASINLYRTVGGYNYQKELL